MSKLKFINELSKEINLYADIDGGGKKGVGPNEESRIPKGDPNKPGTLEFVDYGVNKEVKVIIEVVKLPTNSDGEVFKYALGKKMGRAPHHIEVHKKGDNFTLIIHYMKQDKEDMDPTIKHPD